MHQMNHLTMHMSLRKLSCWSLANIRTGVLGRRVVGTRREIMLQSDNPGRSTRRGVFVKHPLGLLAAGLVFTNPLLQALVLVVVQQDVVH